MNNISCDVCMDLLPLVNDGVASEESSALVFKHIESCESCKKNLDRAVPVNHGIDDTQVVRKIKKGALSMTLTVALFGAFIGVGLSDSAGMFYNVVLMPAIGVVSFFTLGKKSIFAPLFVFVLEYVRYIIQNMGQITGDETTFVQAVVAPGYVALVYAILCFLGLAIGFLLKYAFRKGDKYEKNN